jgi:PKD repeat protein
MDKNRIITIIICLLLIGISYTVTAANLSKTSLTPVKILTLNKHIQDRLMLVRIPFNDYNYDFIADKNYEIVEYRLNEYIEIIINFKDLSKLIENNINYSIIINDIDKQCNDVRGEYHTFLEIEQILQNISNDHPNITSLFSIGETFEGRNIWCLEITDNPGVDEGEPGVFFIGLHHAREWPTVEICLYIANNLTDNYNIDSNITNMINNRRLWIVPCENPDGYVYSHDLGNNMWRKNRRYFPEYDTYGVDLNRNYAGSLNGDIWGAWGAIGEASVTHDPSDALYCGPGPESENSTKAIKNFFVQNDICASISWHTYGELVLWPWAYSINEITPDDTYLSQVGTTIASLITQQDGTGTYTPQQGAALYPTTGDLTDWAYGYSHYVMGRNTFVYTIEACTSFHPSQIYLDQICEENYKGGFYLLQEAGNINNLTPRVAPPIITNMSTDSDGNYTVTWTQQNPSAQTSFYQLDELTNLSINTDDAESGSSLWNLDGFSLSTTRSHSSSHSFKSRYSNEDNSAMTSKYPITIASLGMNLSFWCWYNIENNYDMGFVEISKDNRYYTLLDTFTGNSNGWIYKQYSLDNWLNESVFIRFRYTTDAYTQNEGFYIDDIYPVPNFGIINTLSNSITNTSFNINNNSGGIYYYRVKGYNSQHGWGDFSTLKSINVTEAANLPPIADFTYTPMNPTTNDLIQFSDNSVDLDGIIINWSWDFGDGNTSNMQNPNYSYQNKGFYDVILTVTDNNGDTDTKLKYFYVRKYGPNAVFSYTPSNPIKNEIIQFTDESYDTSGDNISTWYWEFGDSNNSVLQDPIHSYNNNGSYQVNLTVTNSTNIIDSISKNINVGYINFNIPFFSGWNLITVPVDNGWYASDIANNISGCTSVVKWNPVEQSYWFYIPGYPAFDFSLKPGQGYFVEMNTSNNLSMIGSLITNVNISLKVGWNLIGWYHNQNTTASSLAENISGCTSVVQWKPAEQSYWFYIPGYPAFDFIVTRGMGLFVEVDQESYWHGEG